MSTYLVLNQKQFQWVLVTVGHNPPVPASPCCCIWLSVPGFQNLDIWFSRPGFQDLDRRTHSQDLGFRTLKALHPTVVDLCLVMCLIFFLSLFSAFSGHRQTHARNPVTFLCVQWSQTDTRTQPCHFSLRPVVTDKRTHATRSLFSASSGHRQTHARNPVTFLCVQWSQTNAQTNAHTQQATLYIRQNQLVTTYLFLLFSSNCIF